MCRVWADAEVGGRRMIDLNEFVKVDETKCEEVNNCFGVKEENGERYCRGCGNIQPGKGERK